ncbi:chaperone [Lithospermum erythrorhizon]|uniref:Chaperone n=1 Tax=Lithospermum erythrorhizon TaxID=34254 RepID=A0AAV3PCL1_LITER
MSTPTNPTTFLINQRVHSLGNSTKIGTVKYVGNVEGYSGTWVGVDWDDIESGKHDGVQNGVRYFQAKGEKSGSFVRLHSLSSGISLLEALEVRYKGSSTKEEEDEMYVLSANNKRVSIQLLGKDKAQDKMSRFEQLTNAALSYLGVSSSGPSDGIRATIPKLKELDLTGNLLSDWKDISIICQELPELAAINLSNNLMSHDISGMVELNNIRILVLNHTCITWKQVEVLKDYLPDIEELHLMGNNLTEITPTSSSTVQGFDSLRFLNLEDNNISSWDEIVKLSQLKCLTKLFLNKNSLDSIWYPHDKALPEPGNSQDLLEKRCVPFENLSCLLLGGNEIEDLSSTEALNSFPNLIETRLSENPLSDPGRGGVPRYVLIACLAKVKILNSSEISARERKDSEIRYVRLAMSKVHDHPKENKWLHPRFEELKLRHGIEDERMSSKVSGPQKMASGLISISLKCVGASMGEKPTLTKKLPASTTVGKLKNLCESFFKIKSAKPKLFLQEEGSPFPTSLDDDMASLIDVGVNNESTILVDE